MTTAPAIALGRGQSNAQDVAVRVHELGVWRPVTWTQLMAEAAEIGSGLLSSGVTSGEVVALLMANHSSWVAAYLGIQGIGAVVAPIDPDLVSHDVASKIERAGAVAVVCGDQEQFDKVDEAQQRGSAVSVRLLVVADTRGIRSLDNDDRDDLDRIVTLAQLRRRGNIDIWKTTAAAVKPTDPAVSTNGVSVTHQQVLDQGDQVAARLSLSAQDRILAQASFADPVERSLSLIGLLKSGVTVVVGEGGPLAGSELQQVQPTILHAAPGFLDGIASLLSTRIGSAKGLRKFALGRGWRPKSPSTSMVKPSSLTPLTMLLIVGVIASLVWLAATASMADPVRLLGLVALAVGLFAIAVIQGAAVVTPIRRQLGLNRVRAVVADSSNEGAQMLGALNIPLLHPHTLEGENR
jgi:long-chain acyl-CoA synthetase